MFLWPAPNPDSVNFEKRDVILVVGLLLFMIGLIPFMAPIYAAMVVIAMYFGIKFYARQRRQMVKRDVGEGICAECGSRIYNKTCPDCDAGGR